MAAIGILSNTYSGMVAKYSNSWKLPTGSKPIPPGLVPLSLLCIWPLVDVSAFLLHCAWYETDLDLLIDPLSEEGKGARGQ